MHSRDTGHQECPESRIEGIKEVPAWIVEHELRQVPLLLDLNIKPWLEATIAWKLYDPQELWPASLYVLNPCLETLKDARRQILAAAELDILNLSSGLSYRRNGRAYRIIPPLVEEIAEDGYKPVICDGRHRVFMALRDREPVRCLCLRGVDSKYPQPGLPNPNGWADVAQLDQPPEHNRKKYYRSAAKVGGCRGLATRRNLAVLGIGGGVPR